MPTNTANYGWIKPDVGGSDDLWGGELNTDLDNIDTTVKSVSTVANAAYPASNPAGYVTAAAIPAPYVLPTASTTVLGGVKVDGSTIAINSGVISAAGASITVSDTPPSSPSAGALWYDSVGGQLYVWYTDPNTSQWVPATNQMGGGYATAAYVNSLPIIGDNRIINGDMRIDQRNNGASGTAAGYIVDRWYYGASQASRGTWQRGSAPNTIALGFPYFFSFISSSAYASLATDTFYIQQRIEADMVSDFAWGTANARPVTLSFLANSTVAGTYSGALSNDAGTRTYPFSYSLAGTGLQEVVVTIPGDVTGAWVMSGNARALIVSFDLGCGANFRGPVGAWASANYLGVTGAVSIVATNGAQFALTGVKLEIGSVATPFNRQSLAKSMADCQRYYQQLGGTVQGDILVGQNNSLAAGNASSTLGIATMRAAPTAARLGTWTLTNTSTLTLLPSPSTVGLQVNAIVAGTVNAYTTVGASLSLNAEL